MQAEPRELVVLVDDDDRAVGRMEKLEAHRQGRLHRAFSVFVFDGSGRLLIQRRALGKYHSPGLWSNTCCGHPRPGEDTLAAARRRLVEEMGLVCDLEHVHSFIYRADLGNGLWEHELDHVFVGTALSEPEPHPDEVAEWRAVPRKDIGEELVVRPGEFTAWFPQCVEIAWDRFDASRQRA